MDASKHAAWPHLKGGTPQLSAGGGSGGSGGNGSHGSGSFIRGGGGRRRRRARAAGVSAHINQVDLLQSPLPQRLPLPAGGHVGTWKGAPGWLLQAQPGSAPLPAPPAATLQPAGAPGVLGSRQHMHADVQPLQRTPQLRAEQPLAVSCRRAQARQQAAGCERWAARAARRQTSGARCTHVQAGSTSLQAPPKRPGLQPASCPLGRSKMAAPWVAARRAARWHRAGAHRAAGPAGSAACSPSRPPAAQPSSGGTPRPAAARPAQEWRERAACLPGVCSSWARKRRAVGPSRTAGAGRQQQLGRARRTRAPRRASSSRAACSTRCAASLVTSQLRSE